MHVCLDQFKVHIKITTSYHKTKLFSFFEMSFETKSIAAAYRLYLGIFPQLQVRRTTSFQAVDKASYPNAKLKSDYRNLTFFISIFS